MKKYLPISEPPGDPLLSFDGVDAFEDYRRELDMETGVAKVTYRAGDVVLTREVFISHPDRVMVVRITVDKPGRVYVEARFKSPYLDRVAAAPGRLVLEGCWKGPMPENRLIATVEGKGIRFQTVLKAVPEGGRCEAVGDKLRIEGADAVTFVVAAGTSFVNYRDISGNPAAVCENILARVADKEYATLRRRHEADFRALMGRVHLAVGDPAMNEKPTDERLKAMREGCDDVNLEALCFQFGRYILGVDEELRGRLEAALTRLPPYQINRRGHLQEWIEDWEPGDQGHNCSPNFAFFPGSSIRLRREPQLANAIRKWMDTRQARGGWVTAWYISVWARLEHSDKVADTLSSKGTLVNSHSIRDAGRLCCLVTMSLVVGLFLSEWRVHAAEASSSMAQQFDYHFDGTISREVLENYLDRSVTMAYFLVTGTPERNRQYPYREDDVRLIKNIRAKFIGRAIYRWGGESRLNEPGFWADAKTLIHRVHSFDPDVIFQGCLFEIITRDVDLVKIPSWVFAEFGLPAESRTFSYDAMLNKDGKLVNHWGRSSVPDVMRLETQLWFYYLAGSYINLGCEALHLGQVRLIGMADPDLRQWSALSARIRAHAKTHADAQKCTRTGEVIVVSVMSRN